MKGNRFRLTVAALGFALAVPGAASGVHAAEADAAAAEAGEDRLDPEMRPGSDDPAVRAGVAAYRAGDYATAHDIWRPLAEAGNPEAQFRVGVLYDFGRGVLKDTSRAIEWYRKAAAAGHASAMYNLGVSYEIGDAVPKDDSRAFKWYADAAKLCHVDAQINLGILYALTQSIPRNERDYIEAQKWLLIASALGSEDAARSELLLRRLTTSVEQEEGQNRAQEWLKSHSCAKR